MLGSANLLAYGFSMAVSNYQATKSKQDERAQARAEEERHIELVPEGEREEVRQIIAQRGICPRAGRTTSVGAGRGPRSDS